MRLRDMLYNISAMPGRRGGSGGDQLNTGGIQGDASGKAPGYRRRRRSQSSRAFPIGSGSNDLNLRSGVTDEAVLPLYGVHVTNPSDCSIDKAMQGSIDNMAQDEMCAFKLP